MKKTILIIFLSIAANLVAQKDTLYFDADWQKITKDKAAFYRPMPLKKVGGLYQIKDYYINGNLQMEGYWSDIGKEVLEGNVKWYYKNGQRSEESHYNKGVLDGEASYYSKKGFLRAKGIYKNDDSWSGTFVHSCCFNGYIPEYKEGKRIAQRMYHSNSDQIAVKMRYVDSTTITSHYNREGEKIGELTAINSFPKDGMMATYYLNDESDVTGFEQYSYYENSVENGEEAVLKKDGELIAKGNNKDGKPFNGTFFRSRIVKTYVDGKLEGEEIGYSTKMKIISKGSNKNDTHWNGQFISNLDMFNRRYSKNVLTFKEGQLEGKQTSYYTDDYEKIKSYHYIINEKKEGESSYFDKDGVTIAKGVYKNDIPFDGTFYDPYERVLSAYKEGKKHGVFIQFGSEGEIIEKQEYENDKRTGKVRSKGFFQDKVCECIYKYGNPYSGQVCEELSVVHYEKGFSVKRENYEYDYEKEETVFTGDFSYDHEGVMSAKTVIVDDKTYSLTFKDGKPNNGISYAYYNEGTITYKNGKKEGSFTNLENDNKSLLINGNYTNNLWDGIITFDEISLNKVTTCTYKNGKPIDGTVIENNTFTTYKKGLKQGLEKEIIHDGLEEKVVKTTAYDKGIPLNETWPNQKNDKGEVIQGNYKHGKPFNGYFFDFKPIIASLSQYKDGQITGNQYVGYNHYYSLSVIDTIQYRSGKPYQGKLIEQYKDKLHFHQYNKGKRVKTIVTDVYYINKIKNTISYTNDGYIVTDKDSDLVMFKLTYLNEAKTKAKVVMYSDIDELAGTFELNNNKITAIDVSYKRGDYKIDYALIDDALVITVEGEGVLIKSYPKLDQVEKITYKNFLNPEILFADGEVVLHTYIDNKHIATGTLKYNDMFDGVFLHYNDSSDTYNYYLFSNGEGLDKKYDVSKKELLKLLKN